MKSGKPFFDLRMVCLAVAVLMLVIAGFEKPLDKVQIAVFHIQPTNLAMAHALNPAAAVLMLAAGWLLLCVEFCQPGMFVPGALGMLWMTLGGYAIVLRCITGAPTAPGATAIAAIAVTAVLTAMLLQVAWRARRSKMATGSGQ